MNIFVKEQLKEEKYGYILTLCLDPMLTEFANEIMNEDHQKVEGLHQDVNDYINNKFPNIKINTVKIMLGSLLVASFAFAGTNAEVKAATVSGTTTQVSQNNRTIINGKVYSFSQPTISNNGIIYVPVRDVAEALGGSVWWNATSQTVGINKGDTKIAFVIGSKTANVNGQQISMTSFVHNGTTMVPLNFIGQAFGTAVNHIESTNTIVISTQPYTVQVGDTLWIIANTFGVSVAELQTANQLTSSVLYIGQKLTIPQKGTQAPLTPQTYTVVSGDSLWAIANRFGLSVDALKRYNNLTSDSLYVGQKLNLFAVSQAPTNATANSVTYVPYKIQSGDNMWNLSIEFGVPMTELMSVNKLTSSSPLSIGQEIKIPVHNIAVQPTVSSKHGEYLDWWSEAQYVFTIGEVATVTDFQTGRTFKIKRTIGANHADCEPLTAQDAAIIKQIWGGSYSWKERAVIVEVDGRKIAASMASMPHDIEYIKDNDFDGHFDLHFKNSTRHSDGLVSQAHQRQVQIAAGVGGL